MTSMFPDPNHPPRVLAAQGPASGVRGCPRCGGVGHRAYDPAEVGWTAKPDGSWVVPKTENGPRSEHRFSRKGPALLLRPCECVLAGGS